MKRANLFAIPALVLAMSAGPALPQQDVDNAEIRRSARG